MDCALRGWVEDRRDGRVGGRGLFGCYCFAIFLAECVCFCWHDFMDHRLSLFVILFHPQASRNAPSLQTYFFSSFLFMCPSLRTGIQQNLWRLCVIYRCHGHNDSTVRSCMDRCHRNKDDVLATFHMESTSRTQSYDFVSSHQLPAVHFCSLEGGGRGGLKDRGLDSFKFNCSFFKTRERERERERTRKL